MTIDTKSEVVVIGAGPAGLAVSACLSRRGLSHLLLEREDRVAPAWRRHYDRLHLHTSRGFSALPYVPMPSTYPRYPSRDQVVEYFDAYVRVLGLDPRTGVEVTSIRREGPEPPDRPDRRTFPDVHPESMPWLVESTEGPIRCRALVVATGTSGEPVIPSWPGLESFPGPVLHSSRYRNGAPFAGLDVLVVGFGNSGGEIALDLLEHGARPSVSVRSPVNIVPRDILGVPVLAIAIPLSRISPRIADLLIGPMLRAYYPSYRRLGLRKAKRGPFRQISEQHRIPLLDIGTIREIRRGGIRVERGIERFDGERATFSGGRRRSFDAVVLATGYRPTLPSGVEAAPSATDDVATPEARDLYFCGFHVSPTGMIREVGLEAERIADRIRRCREGGPR